jgi:hypothetical protein
MSEIVLDTFDQIEITRATLGSDAGQRFNDSFAFNVVWQ